MFEISKYKKSNVKISIRLPENVNEMLRKIAKKEDMSFNNVIVSCIENSLSQMDLKQYQNIDIYDDKELNV
jgi:predicted HicB family RNase H-like nuclease